LIDKNAKTTLTEKTKDPISKTMTDTNNQFGRALPEKARTDKQVYFWASETAFKEEQGSVKPQFSFFKGVDMSGNTVDKLRFTAFSSSSTQKPKGPNDLVCVGKGMLSDAWVGNGSAKVPYASVQTTFGVPKGGKEYNNRHDRPIIP
jgi:hypothetical protein